MHVGFEQPLHNEVIGLHEGHYFISTPGIYRTGLPVVIQHRIDDGAGPALRFDDDIAVGVRFRVEERGHDESHGGSGWHFSLLILYCSFSRIFHHKMAKMRSIR